MLSLNKDLNNGWVNIIHFRRFGCCGLVLGCPSQVLARKQWVGGYESKHINYRPVLLFLLNDPGHTETVIHAVFLLLQNVFYRFRFLG